MKPLDTGLYLLFASYLIALVFFLSVLVAITNMERGWRGDVMRTSAEHFFS